MLENRSFERRRNARPAAGQNYSAKNFRRSPQAAAKDTGFEELALPKIPRSPPAPAAGSQNPWRTHRFQMLRLKFGAAAGTAASAGIICSAAAVAAVYLANCGSQTFAVLAAIGTWFGMRQYARFMALAQRDYAPRKPVQDEELRARAAGMIKDLCHKNNLALPQIVLDRSAGTACLIDRKSKHDIIVLNPAEVYGLSDRELRCVLAHELAHSNHVYTRLRDTFVLLNFAARPALLLAATHFFMTNWGGSASPGQMLAFLPALIAAKAVQFGILAAAKLVWNIACRSNESEADLRAVCYTGDPEGAQSLFNSFAQRRQDIPDGLLKLMDHPLSAERVKRIKRWFKRGPAE